MDDHQGAAIVPYADAVYKGVVTDPRTFGPQAAQLITRARREGSVEALVVALRAYAWAQRLALHNADARTLLDEAVALAGQHGLARRLGEVLVSRIAVLQELGELAEAQQDADRAAVLLPDGEHSEMRFQQGVLLQNVGHLQAAGELYRQLLADDGCPPVLQAKAGNNLAHLECELGRPEAAIALLDTAERVAAEVGPTVRAYVAQTRAWVEVQTGRLCESLERFDVARDRYAAAGLPLGSHDLEYSDALAGLRLLPEAQEIARRGVLALPEAEAPLMAAEALLRVARLSLLAGDLEPARIDAERARELLRAQHRQGWLARATVLAYEIRSATTTLADAELQDLRHQAQELERCGMHTDAVEAHLLAGRLSGPAGRPCDAAASLRAAERLAASGPVLVRLRGRLATALLAEASRAPEDVLVACRAGLADLDRHRQALPSTELKVLASAHGVELGRLGLRALLPPASAGSGARVFTWLERTRAAALAPLETPPDERAELELVTLRMLHAELAGLHAAGKPEPVALLARISQAEAAVRQASWATPITTASTAAALHGPPAAARVRRRLGEASLVEYGVLDGRLLAVVLTSRRTRLVELGELTGLTDTIDTLLFALRRLSRQSASASAVTAARLSAATAQEALRRRLLEPLRLDSSAPLVVVPVGELQRVPWAPLHLGVTTVVPSAGVWLRTLDALVPDGPVVLLAGPGLPGATAEVAALSALHPSASVLVPPDSTCQRVVEALAGASLAHLACHGRLRRDNPAFSALELTDGPLSVHELSRRGQAPHRVVLAACESGAQVGFPGDEALGFVSVLLARGSAGVLASSLLVPDEQVLPFVTDVHRQLARGATLPRALWEARQAQDDADPAHALCRAAFDAYGAA